MTRIYTNDNGQKKTKSLSNNTYVSEEQIIKFENWPLATKKKN